MIVLRCRVLLALIVLTVGMAVAQDIGNPLPDLREQAAISQQWLAMRLDTVLPQLMREYGIVMWIVAMREYNEDPTFSSLAGPTRFAARRRTIFVFHDRGPEKGVERLALGGGSQGGLYTDVRDTTLAAGAELWGREQWRLLRSLVEERDPANIAVNVSRDHAFADGLSAGEWEQMQEALGERFGDRIVRGEGLAIDFISVRLPEMLPIFREMMTVVHALTGEAFSNKVITPGVTTTEDVVWWYRRKMLDLGFGTWFQPSVSVQRKGGLPQGESTVVIQRGDLLHCDIGLTGMRLNTDTQHLGYVLREGETDVPPGLKEGLRLSNELQDIVVRNLRIGRTGNEVLKQAQEEMRQAGITGTVYSHPVGQHGHGAGPLIGLWDRQEGVPGRGDLKVRGNTWYSVELQATAPVPEWDNQEVVFAQEEDVAVDSVGTVRWVLERQSRFHVVR